MWREKKERKRNTTKKEKPPSWPLLLQGMSFLPSRGPPLKFISRTRDESEEEEDQVRFCFNFFP